VRRALDGDDPLEENPSYAKCQGIHRQPGSHIAADRRERVVHQVDQASSVPARGD